MQIKRILSLLMIPILLVPLGGCVKAEYEVKNLTVIQGIGIDYDFEKNEYEITVEIFDISQASGMGESMSGNLTKILSVRGKTIASAMNKVTLEIGKTLVYSQERVIVVGKTALSKGMTNIVDFFLRNYKTRSSMMLAVADGCKAADIIKADEGDVSFPSREIQTLLESGKINGYTTDIDISIITEMKKKESSAVYLPLLEVKDEGKSKTKKVSKYTRLSGFAIMKNDTYMGDLTLTEGRGLLFIINKIKSGNIGLDDAELGRVTLKIVSSKTHVKTQVGDKPEFTVKINCVADVIELQEHGSEFMNKEDAVKMSESASKYVKKVTKDALVKCLDEYNADVFGFERRIWLLYPNYYRDNQKDMTYYLNSENVKVEVDFKIRRMGQGSA